MPAVFVVLTNTFYFQVLYRFLEFFSNFDWDNFCVSLWGPVPICSLPDVTGKCHPRSCINCQNLDAGF